MNEKISAFQVKCSDTVNECLKFCYSSRAREFQVAASETLDNLKKEASSLKEESISVNDEESANYLLGVESSIDAINNELKMWIRLKDDDPNAAWDHLVDAQMAAIDAAHAHPLFSNFVTYSKRLELLEKALFPPQTFVSMGSTATRLECSICGEESGECDHLPGKPYMGKFCSAIVRGLKAEELSIVSVPGSKHSRVMAFSDGAKARNVMTWRLESEETPSMSPP